MHLTTLPIAETLLMPLLPIALSSVFITLQASSRWFHFITLHPFWNIYDSLLCPNMYRLPPFLASQIQALKTACLHTQCVFTLRLVHQSAATFAAKVAV